MKIRIKFSKTGCVKFLGHLDVMHYFQKAMRRAKVDIKYSEGFSPHQIMSFASPLSLGHTTDGDYLDIEVNACNTSSEMIKRLNDVMVEGFEVLSFRKLPDDSKSAMSLVAACDYETAFRNGYAPDDMSRFKEEFAQFISQDEINIVKQTKKSEKIINIKPLIYDIKINDNSIFMKLAAGSIDNLKPELVIKAFYDFKQWELSQFALLIHRTEMYANLGNEENRKLIPLEDLGEDINE